MQGIEWLRLLQLLPREKGDDGDKKRERERKKTSTNVHRRDKINVLIIPGSIIELN